MYSVRSFPIFPFITRTKTGHVALRTTYRCRARFDNIANWNLGKSLHFSYYFSYQFVFRPYVEIIWVSHFSLSRSRFFRVFGSHFRHRSLLFSFCSLSLSSVLKKKDWLMENIRRDYGRYMKMFILHFRAVELVVIDVCNVKIFLLMTWFIDMNFVLLWRSNTMLHVSVANSMIH